MGCGSSKEQSAPSGPPPNRIQKGISAAAPLGQVAHAPDAGRTRGLATGGPSLQMSRVPGNAPGNQQRIAGSSAPGIWPKVIQTPSGQYVVHIHHHLLSSPPLGDLPCWTYISDGLSNVNQPEVVFTLLRRKNEHPENFPEAPLEWIQVVHGLANAGLNLQAGQMCDLDFAQNAMFIKLNQFAIVQDPNKWASMRRFGTLVHGIPLMASVFGFTTGTLPKNAHHVIALTHEEAAVARQFGLTRVIGHVGLSVRWFPYPPWVDRDRNDCVVMADQAGSVRTLMPIARIYGLSAMLMGDEIALRIPQDEAKRNTFRQYVLDAPPSAASGFDLSMSLGADSGLVWKTGQKEARAYSSIGKEIECLNLCFITFAPQQDRNHSVMVEDGYGILITDPTWLAIRDAIRNTQDITVRLDDGQSFRLVWEKSVYHNPINGSQHYAQWREYTPSGGARQRAPTSSHVHLDTTVLLVEPPPEDLSGVEFGRYINQVTAVLEKNIPVQPILLQGAEQAGRQLIVEIELPRCEGWLKMSAFPSMDGLATQQIMPEIARIVQPRALSTVKAQCIYNLWGYEGPIAHFS